jgi:hypothetical protein
MIQSLETHAENLSALIGAMRTVAAVLDKIPHSLISLAARIFPAAVFWMSEQTKVEGFHVTDNAIALFRDEYALPWIVLDRPSAACTIRRFTDLIARGKTSIEELVDLVELPGLPITWREIAAHAVTIPAERADSSGVPPRGPVRVARTS